MSKGWTAIRLDLWEVPLVATFVPVVDRWGFLSHRGINDFADRPSPERGRPGLAVEPQHEYGSGTRSTGPRFSTTLRAMGPCWWISTCESNLYLALLGTLGRK
jgi:hypothetical protein